MADRKPIPEALRDLFSAYVGASGESLQKIKLGRGVVGKITVISVVALVSIASVAFRLPSTAALLVAVGVIAVVGVLSLMCVLYVVAKQPEIAVLEGAELTLYKQITLGVKGQPALAPAPPVPEPKALPGDDATEGDT